MKLWDILVIVTAGYQFTWSDVASHVDSIFEYVAKMALRGEVPGLSAATLAELRWEAGGPSDKMVPNVSSVMSRKPLPPNEAYWVAAFLPETGAA